MATTNPVTQVLVTSGNQSPIAAGSRVDALAIGQIGIFNYHTGLSIDGSVPVNARDIFLAVGIDPDATGSLADVNKSAGQMIQVRNAKSFTAKPYIAGQAKVIDITDFKAKCETDYALKVEFRNQQIYMSQGYNQFTKTFTYLTGCCADECDTCADGDCNELALGLRNEINADTDGLVTAVLIDYTTSGYGASAIVVTDYDAWVAANPTKCLGIRLTSVEPAIRKYSGINLKYYSPRGTDMIVSTGDSFTCNGTVTTYKELVFKEGSGYDIKQLEYLCGGWNGKPGPYRVSTLTNTQREGIVFFADQNANYTQLDLTYDIQSVGGWEEYLNNIETLIAIPCADTTTLTELVGFLDLIFTQFGPMTNDVAAWDCTNAVATYGVTNVANQTLDGIESLA